MTVSTHSDLRVISASGRISIDGDHLIFRKGFRKFRLEIEGIDKIIAKSIDSITFDEVVFSIESGKIVFVIGESQPGFLEMSDFLSRSLQGFDSSWRAKLDGIYSDKEIILWERKP
jgi:hypothetical protein